MGQAAGRLELMIVPGFELGDGLLWRKIPGYALAGDFPGRRLGAVFAKFEHAGIGGLCPGAADAHEAFGLVLLEQDAGSAKRNMVARETLHQ